ncbi:putative HAD superfamily hydrolase [Xylona heveae TC161]|uniref:Putative HAD superfamily hydrolase n=1 Tax=Xylona heveae (strain CBS 132557 / TC161) TaxID=1328760 RepID=A0A164ZG71_XYLHT|nr:putative HAD superfamily hydrolase [Xylona heveae TC161]KZF19063.1 putative HAD superfamily hydrolase [Xylona heveae TC161]
MTSRLLSLQVPIFKYFRVYPSMPFEKPGRPRRFAPLQPEKGRASDAPKLQGIVFDVDGTLCEPQTYMFKEMRGALGIPKSVDILEHIYSLPTLEQQNNAMKAIQEIEGRAMLAQKPQAGLVELMQYLDSRGVQKGICTRNFDKPVSHLITKFLNGHVFHPIITREFRPPKPDPAGILHIAQSWALSDGGTGLIMVGDSMDDMTAGYRAGAATVLLVNEVNAHLAKHEHTDLCITRLDELIPILEDGFVGEIDQGEENPDTRSQAESALERK